VPQCTVSLKASVTFMHVPYVAETSQPDPTTSAADSDTTLSTWRISPSHLRNPTLPGQLNRIPPSHTVNSGTEPFFYPSSIGHRASMSG
jgi:hypothetical protein